MPEYPYHCNGCSTDFEWVSGVDKRNDAACPGCGGHDLERLWTVPEVSCGWCPREGYFDNGMGCHVKNPQHRKEEMKRRGLKPLEKSISGMKELLRDSNERKQDTRRTG